MGYCEVDRTMTSYVVDRTMTSYIVDRTMTSYADQLLRRVQGEFFFSCIKIVFSLYLYFTNPFLVFGT